MKRLALVLLLLPFAVPFPFRAADPVAPPKPNEVRLNGHTFTLPPGFTVDLVAATPLVDRPVVADFDEQGRLYVAEVDGKLTKDDVAQKKPMHRIVRLEDADGDGKFDKSVVFADKMTFPEGAMWLNGSLYVGAPPIIWKLTDTDGDGVADKREEWFDGKTLTGCANDLHGPYAGPDGWVYWCKGAFAKQTYELTPSPLAPLPPGGEGKKKPFVTRAAHIFRCRPDGTGLEAVMTGGMDNPVDVAFTPGGERIFTTTFFQHPAGGKRDGLIHAIYGGIYGKDHDVIYDPAHKWTSPSLMPVLTHMGAAAPCGLTRYESDSFGKEYKDNLFACQFNMRKVSRHVLEPEGATFKSRDEDFLVSDNLDFHPTDVIEDADGSLLVIDTGGWYKLCCPTSQLHKPDVLGAIYRVRLKDGPRIEDSRGLKLAWPKKTAAELGTLLGDPRPAVRRRAVETLSGRPDAMPTISRAVRSGKGSDAGRNAVWAAAGVDGPAARAAVRRALSDADETVRQAAIHSVSLWRDREAVPALVGLLSAPSLHNRRAAAEALCRIGDKAAVPPLLKATGETTDVVLTHSLVYALIEIADAEGTAAGLKSENFSTRRAALIALDQMGGGHLDVKTVLAAMETTDPKQRHLPLKEAAEWVASRRPEWAEELTVYYRERLSAITVAGPEAEELTRQLARLARSESFQKKLTNWLGAKPTGAGRAVVMRAMVEAGLKEAPQDWVASLASLAYHGDEGDARAAVTTLRALKLPKSGSPAATAALTRLAGRSETPKDVRLNALAAVPGGLEKVEPALFDFVRSHLGPDEPVALRSAAAEVLARARLSSEQLVTLAELLKKAGPMELDRLQEAFAQSTDEAVGRALLAGLTGSPARASLRVDAVKQRLAKYPAAIQKEAEELYAAVDADNAKQRAKLEELATSLKGGDVRRGQAVFNGSKGSCFACHAVGYLGGKIGPDLTHIGKVRTERDLLEAIVFPSLSFVRSYEPVMVITKSGKTHNGLVKKDAPDEMVLVIAADQEVRIPREDIDEVQPGKVSVMPAGLDQQLTPQELADLVAFLKACQ